MENNPEQTVGEVNVEYLNTAAKETVIHIDLNKTFYTITPAELTILEEGSTSIWKDVALTGVAIGIPCSINAIIEYNKESAFNAEVFWNGLFGGIAVTLAIIFGIIWLRSKNPCKDLIADIKKRPKYRM